MYGLNILNSYFQLQPIDLLSTDELSYFKKMLEKSKFQSEQN